ncbi:MAG: hypothetical protein WCI91_01725 [Candidatus Nomurabacteria bacterium]
MKNIDVNIRFVIFGSLYVLNIIFNDILLLAFSIFISLILGVWAVGGLLKSFPDFTVKNQIENNQNIIFVYFRKILNIFIKFLLAMLSFSLPFIIYSYLKP